MKRFTIGVSDSWVVTITLDQPGADPQPIGQTRALGRTGPDGLWRFPLPSEPIALPPGEPAHSYLQLCAGNLKELSSQFKQLRETNSGPVEAFGRYLFTTLLADDNWQAILQATAPEREIELALTWADTDTSLHRLNWEMMCAPDGFLAASVNGFRAEGQPAQPLVHAAITRRAAHAAPLRPFAVPPHILFVGAVAALSEEQIRPAAEYLNLMQPGRALISSVLLGATRERLKDAVQRYRPDVLWFAGHGGFDSKGGFLELLPGPNDKEPRVRVYANALLEAIKLGDDYPPVVVLSACSTGTVDDVKKPAQLLNVEAVAPLASALVANGVPVVVAMAGRVADSACQLFARRFGAALTNGEPFVRAAMVGRHAAAFNASASLSGTTNWALPTIYLAANVPSDFRPFDPQAPNPLAVREQRLRDFDIVERSPAFYGRHEFFEALNEMLHPSILPGSERKTVLAVWVREKTAGIGRTRLLKELATLALREGHVPVLIGKEFLNGWRSPNGAAQFGGLMLLALINARDKLGLELMESSQLLCLEPLRLALDQNAAAVAGLLLPTLLQGGSAMNAQVRQALMTSNLSLAVKYAIRADLAALATDARTHCPDIQSADGRAVVFCDDVEEYGSELLKDWLGDANSGLVGPDGFGSQDKPAPTVMVFSLGDMANDPVAALKTKLHTKSSYASSLELRKLDETTSEDLLACGCVLLNPPFRVALEYDGQVVKLPLMFNAGAPETTRKSGDKLMRKTVKGLPGAFGANDFYDTIGTQFDNGYIVAASDEVKVEGILKP